VGFPPRAERGRTRPARPGRASSRLRREDVARPDASCAHVLRYTRTRNPRPLDRPNRTRAANALAAYLRGEIDNFKLDDETLSLDTDDKTLRRLSWWLWGCYDDIKRHTVHATPEGWDFLGRCLAFLRTDLELAYRKPARHQSDYAPFRSHEEWLSHRHLLDPENLPAYDPDLHGKSPWGPILGAKIRLRWLALAAALLALIFSVC
jgi:hypothetical protein